MNYETLQIRIEKNAQMQNRPEGVTVSLIK